MRSIILKVAAPFALLVVFASGCEAPNCGTDLVYDPANHLCICRAPAVLDPETDLCVVPDGGVAPDSGADPDGGVCRPTTEQCNAIDDDCDTVIDGPAAGRACGDAPGAVEVACTAGECLVASCAADRADCDGDFSNGCEVDLRSDLAHCGSCGNACAWECANSECDDPVQISVGGGHVCAVRASGRVACWGGNNAGQLGDGSTTNRSRPIPVIGLTDAVQVACSSEHTCAAVRSGDVYCWGANEYGQLGDGTTSAHSAPNRVLGVAGVEEISASASSTCARNGVGDLWCWGVLGSNATSATQTRPTAITSVANIVALGRRSAIDASGQVHYWGGTGLMIRTFSAPTTFTTIARGGQHLCATDSDGAVWCWGLNNRGQFGSEPGPRIDAPIRSPTIDDVVNVAAGFDQTCVVERSGAVRCAGGNYESQLGDGTTIERHSFEGLTTRADGASHVSISEQGYTGCVIGRAGPYCWGLNHSGQLGDGTTEDRSVPVRVLAP